MSGKLCRSGFVYCPLPPAGDEEFSVFRRASTESDPEYPAKAGYTSSSPEPVLSRMSSGNSSSKEGGPVVLHAKSGAVTSDPAKAGSAGGTFPAGLHMAKQIGSSPVGQGELAADGNSELLNIGIKHGTAETSEGWACGETKDMVRTTDIGMVPVVALGMVPPKIPTASEKATTDPAEAGSGDDAFPDSEYGTLLVMPPPSAGCSML